MEPEKVKIQELNNNIITCRRCERLVAWREKVAREKKRAYLEWQYWGKPVTGFGDLNARILIVGLAPGAHGSNRTGRMFTGDASGDFLYAALFRAGFANKPMAHSQDDGLVLKDVYITAVCRCAPPNNRPTAMEIGQCRPFLLAEMEILKYLEGFVALGKIAFDEILSIYRSNGNPLPRFRFHHGGLFSLGQNQPWLLASYHPSRQNTQTGRLTQAMFAEVWEVAREKLDQGYLGRFLVMNHTRLADGKIGVKS